MSDLFIPKKIKVGFQKREGTYTGRLAYVIYFDHKGELRKEKSWQTWRDDKIPAEEYDNNPQDGFCLNKDVKRFNWSHFGSNRSYIRMYDPRGVEFEVTPENLIGILTETDCLKRGLEGKFVYAWKGTELVLLPCGSEEYVKAVEHTERQDQNISARDLKQGCSYTTKKGEEVIYIGRFNWYEWDKYSEKKRTKIKTHIFAHPQKPQYGGIFFRKSDAKFLAVLNSPDPVSNYADLVDEWNKDVRSSGIDGFEFLPEDPPAENVFETRKDTYGYLSLKNRTQYTDVTGDQLRFWSICLVNRYMKDDDGEPQFTVIQEDTFNTKTMSYQPEGHSNRGYYNHYGENNRQSMPKEKILDRITKSVKVMMLLSSGKKIQVKSVDEIMKG